MVNYTGHIWKLFILFSLLAGCTAPGASVPAGLQHSSQTPFPSPTSLPIRLPTIRPVYTLTPIPTVTAPPLPEPPSPTPVPTATNPTVTPLPTASGSDLDVVHIAAVGDVMLDRTLGEVISRGRIEYPFAAMGTTLSGADFTIGNLESALGDIGEPAAEKSFPFRAPPAAAEALAVGGFDLVSLANNHAMDYGPEALLQGIALLEAAGVGTVGAGPDRAAAHAPFVVEIKGQRLAFLAYVNVPVEVGGFDVETWDAGEDSPGLAWGRLDEMTADIAAIRPQVDHVIILLHSGLEYVRFTGDIQRELARGAIDAGASVVIGHHAHILQGIERYGNGLIAYGLGNFAFDINGEPDTAVLHLWLHPDGRIIFELQPAVIQVGGAPRPATAEEAAEILEKIEEFLPLQNR